MFEALSVPAADVGWIIPFRRLHLIELRQKHRKVLPAKTHYAATPVDREDNPAPGTG
ncbi:hypothetical protein [Rhizobium sp. LjRoot258]|uniref:hypothetical protein n=1 Tax=Rhizobium sp. LjRoot258 TaxID=3342299 RepID=UPI003ED14A31